MKRLSLCTIIAFMLFEVFTPQTAFSFEPYHYYQGVYGASGPLKPGLLAYFKASADPIGVSSTAYLRSRAAVGVDRYVLPTVAGTTYYVDTNDAVNGDGSFASPFNTVAAAYAAAATGDAILFLPGTHSQAGVFSWEKGVLVSSYSGNPSDTIIDFGSAANLWQAKNHTGSLIIDALTLRNSRHASAGALQISSTEADVSIVQRCIFRNNNVHINFAGGSSGVIRWNQFFGAVLKSRCIYILGNVAGDHGINIHRNIFGPSADYLSGSALFISSSLNSALSISFNNNIMMGAQTQNQIYVISSGSIAPAVTGSNNVIFAGRHDVATPTVAIGGSASNCNFTNTMIIGPTTTDSVLPNGTAGATISGTVISEPGITRYPRKGFLALGIDDTTAYDSGDMRIGELLPVLETYGTSMTWFVTAATVDDTAKSHIKTWLDAGHEIGLHGLSHTSLRKTTSLEGVTKTGTALTITIDDSDQDPTNWTGTVSIDGGNSVAVDGNYRDSTNISTIQELKTWFESEGVTVSGAAIDELSLYSAIVGLADQTSLSIASPVSLALDDTRLKKTEIIAGKALLEAQVRTITGYADYVCRTASAPFNDNDSAGMDVIKDAGLLLFRSDDNPDVTFLNMYGASSQYPLNIFSIGDCIFSTEDTWFGALVDSGTGIVTPAKAYGHLAWLAIQGGVSGLYVHKNTGPLTYITAFLDAAIELQSRGSLMVGSYGDIATHIRTTGTMIEGDGTGSQEQWYLDFGGIAADYNLLPTSNAKAAGVDPHSSGDGDQYDAAGYKVWSDDTDSADNQALYGWSIGAYQYPHAGGNPSKCYYHAEIVSGSTWADLVIKALPFSQLVSADDGTWFTAGVGNEIDATDRAAMAGDQFFYSADRGLGIYDEALAGKPLARADNYFGF